MRRRECCVLAARSCSAAEAGPTLAQLMLMPMERPPGPGPQIGTPRRLRKGTASATGATVTPQGATEAHCGTTGRDQGGTTVAPQGWWGGQCEPQGRYERNTRFLITGTIRMQY